MNGVLPDLDEFRKTYEEGRSQLLWLSLAADLQTPVSAYLKLADDDKQASYLLESVEGGTQRGRYSFIACQPDIIWKYEKGQVSINNQALQNPNKFEKSDKQALDSLQEIINAMALEIPAELPPMACTLGGYLAYDCIRLLEDIPDNNEDFMGLPDGIFVRPTLIAVFDNVSDSLFLVTPVFHDKAISAQQAYDAGMERIMQARTKLDVPLKMKEQESQTAQLEVSCNLNDDEYMAMVEQAKDYIAAGDIFQVVLSRQYKIDNFNLPPIALYRSLRRTNPSPYMFYLNFGGFQIVGSSPEILVQLSGKKVTIRPIAGTRKRGSTPAQDEALAQELLSDEKECAEHLMLLDLGRNDCGRVAEIGSVKVTDSFFIERYSHVMHIVSNVEGILNQKSYNAVQALMAGFPAGTVSGAPKIRAMQIIDELESQKRGIYSGCIGHFSAGGDMNSCIALRTAVVKDNCIYIQAGAGIVADSSPESEANECRQKAQAIIMAANQAHRYGLHYNNGNY